MLGNQYNLFLSLFPLQKILRSLILSKEQRLDNNRSFLRIYVLVDKGLTPEFLNISYQLGKKNYR